MKIKKITKNINLSHTWDLEVPETHNYTIGDDDCRLICHNSSATQNTTNGVEPARSLLAFKSSKKSSIPYLVPNVKTHGQYYQLAYDMPDNIGYLNICNTIQKWMDMSMSVNQYFNPSNYEDKKIPYSQIIKEMIHHFKCGGKSWYYLNSYDGNVHFTKAEKETSCESGACSL